VLVVGASRDAEAAVHVDIETQDRRHRYLAGHGDVQPAD
jgi:hypothetical protein